MGMIIIIITAILLSRYELHMWASLLRSGLRGQQVFFDAEQHIIHETLPWSAFKGTILLDYLCFMCGPKWWPLWWGDADSAGIFPIMCPERKQTLLSPPARTMWLVTNKWNGRQLSRGFFLTDSVLLDILPVWNRTKQRGKHTQSTNSSTDSDHRKQITGVKKRPEGPGGLELFSLTVHWFYFVSNIIKKPPAAWPD